jgi:hypothetical protein
MIIKFYCKNHCLDFEKTSEELCQEKVITHCPYCGLKLQISNMDEVVAKDIEQQIERYVSKCLREFGLEGTIEAIEHLQNQTIKNLYQDELRRRKII